MYQYGYFFGSLIVGIPWLYVFLRRRDLRLEMLFGGIITVPFGMTEYFFVPEYWNPPSLFDLIHRIGFGVESVLFSMFVGGLAAVLYEYLSSRKLSRVGRTPHVHLFAYLACAAVYGTLEVITPATSIFNLTFSLLLPAFLIALERRDLVRQMLASAAYFGALYFVLFFVFLQIFRGYVDTFYNLRNLLGISLAGVPLEEILFAVAVGAGWATMYEYAFGYREKMAFARPR